jgi:hypothetical protein
MQDEVRPEVIAAMKRALEERIEEWLGFDIPDEGTEDYERWQNMVAEVAAIESIDDVISYVESIGVEVEAFLEDFDLGSTG